MRKIKFIKDFAGRKKDDSIEMDGLIASSLVTRKIAKYVVQKPKTKQKK